MNWTYGKQNVFKNINIIDEKTGKCSINLTPNTKNIPNKITKPNMRYIQIFVNTSPTLDYIKEKLLYLQTEYDKSIEVNSFNLNGKPIWLDKATRVGLVNSLNVEKQSGKTDTTLWFNDTPIDVNIDKALALLTSIELYAKECYDNTHNHLRQIANLTTIDECLAFDITANYPNNLNIEIE